MIKSGVKLSAYSVESSVTILGSGSPAVASEGSPYVIVILIPVLNSVEDILSIESYLHLLI